MSTGPGASGPVAGPGRAAAGSGAGLGPAFWQLWWASTASALGDGVRRVALPLLALTLTRDPIPIALVAAAGSLPGLLVALLSGAIVDRWDRLRVMWSVNAVRAGVVMLLIAAVACGRVSIWVLAVVALLIGTGETLVDNAVPAVLPRLVAADLLERANGRLYAGEVVTGQFVGQGIGGGLFALAAVVPFVLDAAVFVTASLVVLALSAAVTPAAPARAPARPPRAAARRGVLSDVAEGLRWLAGQPLLRGLWIMIAALGFASGAFWGIVALYSVEVLHLPPGGYGLVLAVGAGGSLLGSLGAAAVRARIGTTRSIRLAVTLITTSCAGLALTANGSLAALLMVVNGAGVLLWNVVGVSLRQRLTPPGLLGRVNAAFSLAALGAMSLGSLAAGLIAHLLSVPSVFWASAAVVAVTGLATARSTRAGQGVPGRS